MQELHSISEIRAIVNPIAKAYGAERVFLFGSYARGDAHPGSDVDLRVDKGAIRGLHFAGMLGDLQDALGTSVDLVSTNGMDETFRRAIAPEEVLLYERQ